MRCQSLLKAWFRPGWDISGEPGSQVPTKSSVSHESFAAIHAAMSRIWHQGISIFPLKWRSSSYHTQFAGNIFLSQEETSWHWKLFIVTGIKFLSQKGISYQGQTYLVTGRNFFSQEDFLVTGRICLSEKETFCHRKERNFMPQLEISCHRKKFLVTGRNFVSKVC